MTFRNRGKSQQLEMKTFHDFTVTLGDQIQDVVEDAYRQLSPVCKPVVRSNEVKEWTVLAGVVLLDNGVESPGLRLLSIATGVKSLPDWELRRSQGRMLHDCHAETLALRGLNRVLLEHIKFLEENDMRETDILERHLGRFRMKPSLEMALYVSALPCGDASMGLLKNASLAEMERDIGLHVGDDDAIQFVEDGNRSILRGRMNYNKLGFVRTKPGRIDSQISVSKSCCDKLCLKQMTSVLNCMTWEFITDPIFIKYLVLPPKHGAQGSDLKRSFHERMNNSDCVPLIFLSCSKQFEDDKTSPNDRPCSMSSIKLFFQLPNMSVTEEAILNGVKNGFYTKGKKPLRKNCDSIISRRSQWRLFITLNKENRELTYLDFKKCQHERIALRDKARRRLSPDGWISTVEDNVVIDEKNPVSV